MARFLLLILGFSFVCGTFLLMDLEDEHYYKGVIHLDERSALDMVMEYGGDRSNNFEIVGEGNSVDLRYNLYTNDDLPNLELDSESWWDRNGHRLMITIGSIIMVLTLLSLVLESFRHEVHSSCTKI